LLVLRRRRGWIRNFSLTPKNRYVFKTDLERALQRAAVARGEPLPVNPPEEPGSAETAAEEAEAGKSERPGSGN
jgi:hypothetical protein